jgi:hypothetical protein
VTMFFAIHTAVDTRDQASNPYGREPLFHNVPDKPVNYLFQVHTVVQLCFFPASCP